MERRQYTPTKISQYTHLTNANVSGRSPLDRSKTNAAPDYSTRHEYTRQEYSRPDYTSKSISSQQMDIIKEYEALKMQVRQMQSQNRQLSNEVEKLRYEKNIHENKYMQKVSYEEEAIAQFQKEKNYQMELLKIKNDQDSNKLKRQYEYKLDDLQRQLRNKDYHNRQYRQKNSYIELKINELHKGIQILECEHIKVKQSNNIVTDHLTKEQYNKKKLVSITEELEVQKREMEEEIHVLLDIEADKSRTVNTLESQLRNAEADERSLHQKLTVLTDNFASLEEHITIMKQRLVSTDCRNEQLEQQLHSAEYQLHEKDNSVLAQKDLEVRLRKDLEVEQQRQAKREKQIQELIAENQRLIGQVNMNRQRLQDVSLVPGVEV